MSWTWLISCVFKCSTIFGWACLGMRSLGLEASTSESTSIFRSHDVWDEIPSLAELPVAWGTRESYPPWRPESKTIIFAKPLTLSSIWTPHVLHANSSLHARWKKWLPDDNAHGQESFSHMGEHLHRPHLWNNLSALIPSRHDHSLPPSPPLASSAALNGNSQL